MPDSSKSAFIGFIAQARKEGSLLKERKLVPFPMKERGSIERDALDDIYKRIESLGKDIITSAKCITDPDAGPELKRIASKVLIESTTKQQALIRRLSLLTKQTSKK